jgi:hypothetical protein
LKRSNRNAEKNLLISRLNQWAVKHSLLEDPYLVSVSRAIENNDSLDFWATLDPGTRLPRPLSKVGEQLITWARYMAIFRNILVFVPVAVTWKAIAEATSAFSEFINSNTATPVNFLEFWQNGYGLLDPIYRIGTVAEIDFWIIIFVIATTMVSTTLLNIGRSKDAKEQVNLDSERELISFEIHKYLSVPEKVNKAFTEQTLNLAIRNLSAATESIALAAKRFDKVVDRASAENNTSQAIAKEVRNFQKSILKAIKKSQPENK